MVAARDQRRWRRIIHLSGVNIRNALASEEPACRSPIIR